MKKIVYILFGLALILSACSATDSAEPVVNTVVDATSLSQKYGGSFIWQSEENGYFVVYDEGVPILIINTNICDPEIEGGNLDPNNELGNLYDLWYYRNSSGVWSSWKVNHQGVFERPFIKNDGTQFECDPHPPIPVIASEPIPN